MGKPQRRFGQEFETEAVRLVDPILTAAGELLAEAHGLARVFKVFASGYYA